MTSVRKHGKDYSKISKDVGSKGYVAIADACKRLRYELSKNKEDEEDSTLLAELQPS